MAGLCRELLRSGTGYFEFPPTNSLAPGDNLLIRRLVRNKEATLLLKPSRNISPT